jgi:hypothetical protein
MKIGGPRLTFCTLVIRVPMESSSCDMPQAITAGSMHTKPSTIGTRRFFGFSSVAVVSLLIMMTPSAVGYVRANAGT